jgi:hypothetical protein
MNLISFYYQFSELPTKSLALGITQFMEDIQDSVYRHGGYLDLLETTPDLQYKFEKAIVEMFQS